MSPVYKTTIFLEQQNEKEHDDEEKDDTDEDDNTQKNVTAGVIRSFSDLEFSYPNCSKGAHEQPEPMWKCMDGV